jgi:pimeloyl-ACP methyl ester carboxylesterase
MTNHQPQERMLEIPSGQVCVRSWGNEGGKPVLGFHGWLDNAGTHDHLAPLLPGLNLVSVDWPGHGRSQWRSEGGGYHFVDWIADGFHVADALGWDRFSVLAHSMGAAVASMMAGVCPERIIAAVLLEGLGPLVAPAEEAPQVMATSLESEASLRGALPREFASMEEAIERRIQAAGIMDDRSARTLMQRGLKEVEGRWRLTFDPRLRIRSRYRFTEEQVEAYLRAITSPVLLVRAEKGWPFEREMMKARVDCLRDQRLLTVPGGHHVHLDAPDSIAGAIHAFLA